MRPVAGASPTLDAAHCSLPRGCTRMHDRRRRSWSIDRSIQMLRRAVKRLADDRNELPNGVVALHADGARLPVRSAVFSSILSLNLLHVACDRHALVAECRRTLVPGGGRLYVSSLVRSGRWSDGYLSFLHRVGEFGTPLTCEALSETVAGSWGRIESSRVEGNMAYLVVRHAG
jgi:SAM-dependent methyltransferase